MRRAVPHNIVDANWLNQNLIASKTQLYSHVIVYHKDRTYDFGYLSPLRFYTVEVGAAQSLGERKQ
jgi:hypothetical protein